MQVDALGELCIGNEQGKYKEEVRELEEGGRKEGERGRKGRRERGTWKKATSRKGDVEKGDGGEG